MILTPVAPSELPALLVQHGRAIGQGLPGLIFARLAQPSAAERAVGELARRHHAEAVALARRFGMGLRAGAPAEDFSWDGAALRIDTEAYVLLHEVAHFQLAAPQRRRLIDFGLGPGPETGARAAAERAARLSGLPREREEAMASLLGILWEAALGHPALASFIDQNWLEGAGRTGSAEHLRAIVGALRQGDFIDAAGHPLPTLRSLPDPVDASCSPSALPSRDSVGLS
jgi:hypothetical protein